jgi:hypothetical protein
VTFFQGFEPRGTDILNRVVTHEKTLEAAIEREELTCEYKRRLARRERRESETFSICSIKAYRYVTE